MAQHSLNSPDIGSAPDQMGCKGMAQGMGGNIPSDPGLFSIMLYKLPESLTAHGAAAAVGKQPV